MSVSDRLNSALEEPSNRMQYPHEEDVSGNSPRLYKPRNGGGFLTGFDITTKEEQLKRALRAKKFGVLEPDLLRQSTNGLDVRVDNADDGDGNCDVVGMELDAAAEPIIPVSSVIPRENAIHLYGTDQMSTKDVLKYFADYGPTGVEWINDSSCNVVFDDIFTAKRALVGLTDPSYTRPHIDTTDENPLLQFAPGIPYKPSISENSAVNTGLMIRYATDLDVKQRGAAQVSRYYLEHGRPGNEEEVGSDIVVDTRAGRNRKRIGERDFAFKGKRSILDRLGEQITRPDDGEPNYDQETTSHSAIEGDLGEMIREQREQRERRDDTYPVLPEGDLAHILRGRRARREQADSKSGLYSDRAGYGAPQSDAKEIEVRPARNSRSRSPENIRKLNTKKASTSALTPTSNPESCPNLEQYISQALQSLQTASTFTLHILNSPLLPREPLIQSTADFASTYYRTRLVVVGQIQPNRLLEPVEVFVFALYVHEYQTFRLDSTKSRELGPPVSSIYIEKVDTTGCAVFEGKRPPLARAVVGAYLRFLEDSLPALDSLSQDQIEPSHLPRRHLLHLFARSSDQYIFNNSSKNPGKPKRDGRSLVQWWKQTVDASLGSERQRLGYWYVPGAEEMDIGRSIPGVAGSKVQWTWGWPYPADALARSVIPFFPDDAKCRQLEDDGIASPDTTVQDFFTLLAGCCEFTYETAGLMAIELFGKLPFMRETGLLRVEDEGAFRLAEEFIVRSESDFTNRENAVEASRACVAQWTQLNIGTHLQVVVNNKIQELGVPSVKPVPLVNNLQMSVRRKKT